MDPRIEQVVTEIEQGKIPAILQEIWADIEPKESKCFGCGNCCHGNITVLLVEAILLEGKPWVNPRSGGCPFLTIENKCSVREIRPFVCRGYGPDRGDMGPNLVYADILDLISVGVCWHKRVGADIWHLPYPAEKGMELVRQLASQGVVALSYSSEEDLQLAIRAFRGVFREEDGKAVIEENTNYDPEGLAKDFKAAIAEKGLTIEQARSMLYGS